MQGLRLWCQILGNFDQSWKKTTRLRPQGESKKRIYPFSLSLSLSLSPVSPSLPYIPPDLANLFYFGSWPNMWKAMDEWWSLHHKLQVLSSQHGHLPFANGRFPFFTSLPYLSIPFFVLSGWYIIWETTFQSTCPWLILTKDHGFLLLLFFYNWQKGILGF